MEEKTNTRTSKQWQRDDIAERKCDEAAAEIKKLKSHIHNLTINLNRCRARIRSDREGAKDARLSAHGWAIEADGSLTLIVSSLSSIRNILGYKEEGR